MKKFVFFLLGFLMLIGTSLTANAGKVNLLGAGATFPYPLYSKMFNVYHKKYGIKINYQAIGSGGGIRQIKAKTVDFGASDAFLSDEEMKTFASPVVHIPTCAGAVVITYNLPGNPKLRLTPDVLSDIYLGKIKKWNNKRIAKLNPNIRFPNENIIVVHRSDGSGTTFIFSSYLNKVSSEWSKKVGYGKSLDWPVGLGGKGNPGVAGLVRQLPGSLGYVELIYALQNSMPYAKLQNKSGRFINPSIKTVTLAADTHLPDDMRVSLTDSSAKFGYPISGFTYIIEYKNLADGGLTYKKAKEVAHLLWWMTHQGQKYAKPLDYAPLSKKAQKKAERIIESMNYNGKKLINR